MNLRVPPKWVRNSLTLYKMDIIMPSDIKNRWGDHGKDWVWEDESVPSDWSEWETESDWAWEDERTNEDWGKEGVDWEWYDGYYTCDESDDESEYEDDE